MSPAPTNTSYTPTIVSAGQQKLNVVTRVAIEGKAKQGQDGVSIKMYLKMSLPLDSVSPGTTIPLFPEENVKILTSQVHPLDNHSVPYNFSSTLSPLLHNAARALNLPARSSETFTSAFSLSSPPSASSVISSRTSKSMNGTSSAGGENIAPIDGQYTGHILVSGYHISYVLPKVFPTRGKSVSGETEGEGSSRSPYLSRRPSIGERNTAQFMAAIDMWIPYVSRPPRSPYLLSIPIPRCLHNQIKLRIFPPTSASASFASLSSLEEDGGSWDLTSDPHVTRAASNRPSRSNSYTHFADDESSDSSTAGFSGGCGIQGSFPSAERIRIRWAKPLKNIEIAGGSGDGRRRVGVKEVKGEMTCVVRGKSKAKERNGAEGLLMDVEYKGTCKGVWFPGVATLLGMDVGLETKGSDVYWVDGFPHEWDVGGGVGYTGFDIGASPRQSGLQSRTSSQDSYTPPASSAQDGRTAQASGANSASSSTSSLLRAPLPAQNVAEYSFEGSTATLASSGSSPLGTLSSMGSLMPTSTPDVVNTCPPGTPITLHINMNEIIAPAKNVFSFTICGTILVVARSTASPRNASSSPAHSGDERGSGSDPEPIVLPRFTVLAADSESTSTIIRNEIDGTPATIEVYNSSGDIYRDAQARKTVLQKGGFTKCTEDGGRISLKSIGAMNGFGRPAQPASRPRTPSGTATPPISSNLQLGRALYPLRPKRDGPLMIPSVVATVTPLLREGDRIPDGYAVRVCLNAPADADSEWLEFGLAQLGSSSPVLKGKDGRPPRVVIVNATVEGVPVKFETVVTARPEASGVGVPFEEMSGKEWVSWVRVRIGGFDGGSIVIDYVVSEREEKGKGKARAKESNQLVVFLPTFSIPIGRLEVNVEASSDIGVAVQSNFSHQHSTFTGHRLLDFSLDEFFYPQLSLTLQRKSERYCSGTTVVILATWALCFVGALFLLRLGSDLGQMSRTLDNLPAVVGTGWNDVPEPITITTTVYAATGTRRWFGEVPTESASSESPSSTLAVITNTISPTDASEPPPRSAYTSVSNTPMPSPSTSSTAQYALLPMQHVISFSWPTIDLHSTFETVMKTVDIVWQLCRRMYHYPLDPT
ncbi:hypothetical protein Hypma_011789 [Hypsizygus marmoreus]|uniref:Uncharacterized protein n=1 Tax=Hypsizygus marmoreus TaxID=39966 RepID=A0A369JHS6_HYPMA|nr:hypothetical protein Hypma_011789 [Hypsizygus marmoreus]